MIGGQAQNLPVRAVMEPAEGFYELGLLDDAWKALDNLSPDDKGQPLVILLTMDILLVLHRFDDAVALGEEGCERWRVVDTLLH